MPTRVRASAIHGRGLFAARSIRRGEVVAVKGGHVADKGITPDFKILVLVK